MITITDHVDIDVARDLVYEFAARFDKNPMWQSDVCSVDVEVPVKANVSGVVISNGLGQETRSTFEVLEAVAGEHIKVSSSTGPLDFKVTYRFESLSANTTRFHWTSEVNVGTYYHLAEPVVEHIGQVRIRANLAAFKLLLESTDIVQLTN